MTWTREEARQVACPRCKAAAGDPCVYRGKGAAKKMRLGVVHQHRAERLIALRRKDRAPSLKTPVTIVGPLYREDDELIDLSDVF